MKAGKIIILILFIAAAGVAYWLVSGSSRDAVSVTPTPELVFQEREHDFEIVKQSGGLVSHAFPFTYQGTEERRVEGVPTSCGCTTAEIDKEILKPGDSGIVTVTFDPNLHAEPEGRFFKTISVLTEPPLESQDELKIWAEIDLDLGPEAYKQAAHVDDHDDEHASNEPFHTVSAETLKRWMSSKDFFLVDVHIPEQEHIPSTDAVIPFNEIDNNPSLLPSDKNEKIVVYCRSGSMSQQAATSLTEMGYMDVYHLEGGIQAYNSTK